MCVTWKEENILVMENFGKWKERGDKYLLEVCGE